ncbi:T3/T7 RNA polymerase [Brevundimonas sp. S30B]|uniref:DNA-directed RNA polymerase n=1 Tax=unclassified Brevundimonas TaxID=2622653 RepID=UPI001071BA26|nr:MULTISPECIES: DNA-directed RNA polymerase [unclassified Brevundimonas]QBX36919.1 T3/T7 RNA polymerase [Brevundimonas sp. MF30-B]TFW04286.1 T3/T7 RNA polymerase [Brevundimonas sp. S30B]
MENESRALGAERYRSARPLPWRNETSSAEQEGDLPPGRQLVRLAIEPTAAAFKEFKERALKGASVSADAADILCLIGDEEAAALTARVVMHSAAEGMLLTATAIRVADAMIDHIQLAAVRKRNTKAAKQFLQRQSHQAQTKRRRKNHKMFYERFDADRTFTMQQRLRAGVKAIGLFCDATDLFVIDTTGLGRRRIRPTEAVHRWLEQQHARCELLNPIHLPMIVAPRRWVSPYKGGYITKSPGNRLVKQANRKYHEQLRDVDMPGVYAAVNAIQATPWRINARLFDVVRAIWDSGGVLGGLPERNPLPVPARPTNGDDDAIARWKREAMNVHDANHKRVALRISMSQRLWIAEKFKDEEEIFFPHALDFRGRIYPIPAGGPNPQGDDLSKSMLEFARGEPIGDGGAHWLAVHLANQFGHDKLPFNERVDWVFANEALILDSARDPLDGQRFWASAENPFLALAACFEWQGYVEQGASYVTHLPVHLDGSNSGLQHFSALLRDPVGGAAVNLVPQDKPADIYAEVAKVAQAKVDASTDANTRLWSDGRVIRKIAKRPTMTYTYSATRFGMLDQVYQTLREIDRDGDPHIDGDNYDASYAMSYILWDSIRETVIAASAAMDWLRQAAKVMTKAGKPIWWTTPMGLPVLQDYPNSRRDLIRVYHQTKEVRLVVHMDAGGIDGRRQANAIAPNVIHSLDAAHLMSVANRCAEQGIDLAVVHDSFGCLPSRAFEMRGILRETFVEQYRPDRLAILRDELLAQLPDELLDALPPLPPMGALDIEAVAHSDYLFG